MFQTKTETINSKSLKIQMHEKGEQLTFEQTLKYWQDNENFRNKFISTLQDIPFQAFFWETPSINSENFQQKKFEFVVIDSPHLATEFSTPQYFSKYFSNSTSIVSFENLGKDALLVVPCPITDKNNYTHLGIFTRQTPLEQQHLLWQTVAIATLKKLTKKNLWINTSGLGVSWLHIRLDSTPKYYKHKEYTL